MSCKAEKWKDLDLSNAATGQITTGLELLLNDSTRSSDSLLRSGGTTLSTEINHVETKSDQPHRFRTVCGRHRSR